MIENNYLYMAIGCEQSFWLYCQVFDTFLFEYKIENFMFEKDVSKEVKHWKWMDKDYIIKKYLIN